MRQLLSLCSSMFHFVPHVSIIVHIIYPILCYLWRSYSPLSCHIILYDIICPYHISTLFHISTISTLYISIIIYLPYIIYIYVVHISTIYIYISYIHYIYVVQIVNDTWKRGETPMVTRQARLRRQAEEAEMTQWMGLLSEELERCPDRFLGRACNVSLMYLDMKHQNIYIYICIYIYV